MTRGGGGAGRLLMKAAAALVGANSSSCDSEEQIPHSEAQSGDATGDGGGRSSSIVVQGCEVSLVMRSVAQIRNQGTKTLCQ